MCDILCWQEVIDGNIGKFTALVGVENYYLPYEVIVQAFNDIGFGPNSTVEVIYSAMGSMYHLFWQCFKPLLT